MENHENENRCALSVRDWVKYKRPVRKISPLSGQGPGFSHSQHKLGAIMQRYMLLMLHGVCCVFGFESTDARAWVDGLKWLMLAWTMLHAAWRVVEKLKKHYAKPPFDSSRFFSKHSWTHKVIMLWSRAWCCWLWNCECTRVYNISGCGRNDTF